MYAERLKWRTCSNLRAIVPSLTRALFLQQRFAFDEILIRRVKDQVIGGLFFFSKEVIGGLRYPGCYSFYLEKIIKSERKN